MKNYLDIILHSQLFTGMEESEAEALLRCLEAKTVEYDKNEAILRCGACIDALGILLQGSATITQEDFWGNRNIISNVTPGQMFAEVFACLPDVALTVSVIADTPATVLFLSMRHLMRTCSTACMFHNRVIQNLLADLAGKNLRFHEKLTHMAQRTTREKLLSYLSDESLRNGSTTFQIPYNRQQLADYLSVDRSAMSNELCKLRDEGILEFQRNHFKLLVNIDR